MTGKKIWRYEAPCCYKDHICFALILFDSCYYQHTEQNKRQIIKRWGDIKHTEKRLLEKTQKQKIRGCLSGINCTYLLKGDCRRNHCAFDFKLAINIRKKLFQTKCPNNEDCYVKNCFYCHKNKQNQLFQNDIKKLQNLLNQAQY